MKTRKMLVIILIVVAISLVVVTSCTPGVEPTRSQASINDQKEVVSTPIVTLEKKPVWLVLGGIDVKDQWQHHGDIMQIGGKTFEFLAFSFETDPSSDPLVVSVLRGNRIIYWKGRGKITNMATREKVALPLSPLEDPRSDSERNSFFEKNIRPH